MQLTPRDLLLQCGPVLQQELIPRLDDSMGPLSPQLQLRAAVAALLPLDRLLHARRARTGRPAADRAA